MNRPTALVTGAGRGIGRAVCVKFASTGHAVVGAARSTDELAKTRIEIERAGVECLVQPCDVRSESDIESLVSAAEVRFGRIDVLVNCAGVAPLASIEQLTPSIFDEVWAVNVKAIYEACRWVWPVMKNQGGGVIVNISSVASQDPFPGFSAYGASKAWVNLWSQGLAEEGRSHNIRVFSVAPGAVETRMLRDAFPSFPEDQTLSPSDVADLVHALTLPSCRFATGQTVFVRRRGEHTEWKGNES